MVSSPSDRVEWAMKRRAGAFTKRLRKSNNQAHLC
jgi:hypothetical protein